MKRLGVLALGVLLAGCGQTVWYKAGATQQDFQQAKYYCLRDARYYTPNPYSSLVQGNNDPSWGLAGLLYQWGQKRQYNDCMQALGWSTTPQVAIAPAAPGASAGPLPPEKLRGSQQGESEASEQVAASARASASFVDPAALVTECLNPDHHPPINLDTCMDLHGFRFNGTQWVRKPAPSTNAAGASAAPQSSADHAQQERQQATHYCRYRGDTGYDMQSAQASKFKDMAKGLLSKRRASQSSQPFCLVGFRHPEAPLAVTAVSEHAEAAGLQIGDRIVAFDGEPVSSHEALAAAGRKKTPGDTAELTVIREGKQRRIRVECLDGRLAEGAEIVALEAAAEGRWQDCILQTHEIDRLYGPGAPAAVIRQQCWEGDRVDSCRPLDETDADVLYEGARRQISEAAFSPEGTDSVKGDVCGAISWLERSGFPRFAEDLRSQFLRASQHAGASASAQSSFESAVVRISSGRSIGSGFFVAESVVATNAHVVQGSKTVLVSLGEKSERAAVVYKDRELDFALLRTSIAGVPLPVRPGSIPLTDGEGVMTLGFPQGRQVLAGSTGTVRGILECCIIHDALVAAGSSGGPLLDANSRVIGINTGLSKTKGDKTNVSDRIWALKMSYISERLQAVAGGATSGPD